MNKKGISLLALVAVIIVMGILAGTVVLTGADAINDSKKMQLVTEFQSIQTKVAMAKLTETLDQVLSEEQLISSSYDEGLANAMQYESKTDDDEFALYQIDLVKLGVDKISRGNMQNGIADMFLYSKETGRIYYPPGVKIGGTKHYTLTPDIDVKNQLTTKDYFPNLITEDIKQIVDGAFVCTSAPEYIKNDDEKIVAIFEMDKDKILDFEVTENENSVFRGMMSTEKNDIYVLNCTGLAAKNGIAMSINTLDGVKTYNSYKVAKFDNTAPTIDTSKISVIYASGSGGIDVRLYIPDGAVTDPEYGEANLEEVRYFFGEYPGSLEKLKKVSRLVTEESMTLGNTSSVAKICIYAEDKAGNAKYQTITVPTEIMEKIKKM